jgi:hypothetical protein
MKLFLFLSSLLFVSLCESIPIKNVSVPIPVSSKKVEVFIDQIGKSLTIEHENALKLVKNQKTISLLKKQKLDILTNEFNTLSQKLTNITETYTQYKKERNTALNDYDLFMVNFKKVEILINKNKIDYETEMKFLNDIKTYIKKVQKSNCIIK